jgi:beta-fructofuranosidase
MGAHRDHFVLELEDGTYLMYVVGVYQKRGAVSCFSSSDLINWQFERFALTSGREAPLSPAWGAFESPYIVKKDGLYYLFITYTDCSDETYNNTFVFCSDDPTCFGEYNGDGEGAKPITVLYAHAPEIIENEGKYYITTCGWNSKPNPNKGCVSIASLEWD